jgi:hypothetical protein
MRFLFLSGLPLIAFLSADSQSRGNRSHDLSRERETALLDFLMFSLIIVAFAGALCYLRLCNRLTTGARSSRDEVP